MGRKGRGLVQQRFTWKVVSRQMADVYNWLAGHGETPPCVLEKEHNET
jgi:hypothetical protein